MEENKKQFLDEDLEMCAKMNCDARCCQNIYPVKEWVAAYFMFHDGIKDKLIADGVGISFKGEKVFFENCSPGTKQCNFLKHSPEGVDLRPLECKIYPYKADWHSVDFERKVVILFCINDDCPLAKNKTEDENFRKEIEKIIKQYFAKLFNGAEFEVEFYKD